MNRIVSRGRLTVSLAVAIVAATGGTASALVTLDPTSVNFGNREVGTTSPPQAHTLNLRCQRIEFLGFSINGCLITGPISFSPLPSTTGDFGETEDCPATLTTSSTTGVSCTINTTFTPTSTGTKDGTLLTGAGGPTAALTGIGVTAPTPPTPPEPGPPPPEPPAPPAPPPPELDLDAKKQELKKRLTFSATSNVIGTLVAEGSIKKTTVELPAGEKTKIQAKLKPKAREKLENKLDKFGKAKAKVEAELTDAADRTAIDEIKVKLKD